MRTAEDVLARIRQALGVERDTDLSRQLEIPKTTISGWKTRNAIPYDLCVQVSDSTGVSLDWLLTGAGDPIRAEPRAQEDRTETLTPQEEAVLALYRALDEDAQREIHNVAEEKKRLRDVERQLQELREQVSAAKRSA